MQVKEKKAQVGNHLEANNTSGPSTVTSDPKRVICSVMTSVTPITVMIFAHSKIIAHSDVGSIPSINISFHTTTIFFQGTPYFYNCSDLPNGD